MGEIPQKDGGGLTTAKLTAPIGSKRSQYVAVVGALIVTAGLIMTVLALLSRYQSGWPVELMPGSAHGFNVLVITLDTTRADRLGCYGYSAAETPVLDALAEQGVRFDDAVTAVPITLPSHATIFTGLDPPNHGVRNNGEFVLTAEHDTLAEVLGGEGYDTAAFVSAFVLDARFGLDQGFDLYDDRVGFSQQTNSTALTSHIHERSAEETSRAAGRWLSKRNRKRPFFCWVHYFDPHFPYAPPQPFSGRFSGRSYDGEIAYMDSQIGNLFKALKTCGAWNNTLIVVVADHGEGLGDHNESTHANLIYRSTMRVPLIVACPGLVHQGQVVNDVVVSISDIFPTVLDLLAIEHGKTCDGRSLVGALPDPDRTIYMETLAPYFDNGWSPLYGLRRHNDKYILAPRAEYYDLRSDPDELNNRYTQVGGAAMTSLNGLIDRLAKRLADRSSLDAVVASAAPLDPESIRKLQSLGYVGSISETDAGAALPDPKDMMPVMRGIDRADALAATGRFAEALAVIKEAASRAPHDSRVLLIMGNVYLRMGREKEADEAFRSAIANTSNPRVPIVAAQVMLQTGQPAKAVNFLRPLCESPTAGADALVNLGIAYLHLGRAEEARNVLLRAERLDNKRFETFLNLATCYQRLGLPAEALEYADIAVSLSPDLPQANQARGLALMQLGENEGALRALATAMSLDARNPSTVQAIANVCMRLGRYPEARTHFETLAKLLPARWEPYLGLSRVNLQLGMTKEARAAVNAGLRLAPDEPRLHAMARHLEELRYDR